MIIYAFSVFNFKKAKKRQNGSIIYSFDNVYSAIEFIECKQDIFVLSNKDPFCYNGICVFLKTIPPKSEPVISIEKSGWVVLQKDIGIPYLKGDISVFDALLKSFAPHLILDDISLDTGIPLYVLYRIKNGEKRLWDYYNTRSQEILYKRLSEYTKIPLNILKEYI